MEGKMTSNGAAAVSLPPSQQQVLSPKETKSRKVAGLITSFCCLVLFVFGNSLEYGHPTTVCLLNAFSFSTELTVFILIYRNVVVLDIEMWKWDTIIHFIWGILFIVIGPPYLAGFICKEVQYDYHAVSTLIHLVAGFCLIGQGAIFLTLGINGQKQFNNTLAKVADGEPSNSSAVKIAARDQQLLQNQPVEFLALRIAGMIIPPLSFMSVIILCTHEMSEYGNPAFLCIIPIVSFGFELGIYFRIKWGDGILYDKMLKMEINIHLILGIFSTLISPINAFGFYYCTVRGGYVFAGPRLGRYFVTPAIALQLPAGIIYLVLAYKCWKRFKALEPVENIDGLSTQTEPKAAGIEVKERPPENNPSNKGFCGILRIAVIVAHLLILLLVVFGTTLVFDYFDPTCALSIGSFIFELIGFLRVHWNIGIFEEKRLKSEIIIHVSLGTVSLLIATAYLVTLNLPGSYSYILFQNWSLNVFINHFAIYLLQGAWGLTFAQGVCYLIRAFLGWKRFEKTQTDTEGLVFTINEPATGSSLKP